MAGLLDTFNEGIQSFNSSPGWQRAIARERGDDPNAYGLLQETQKRTQIDEDRIRQRAAEAEADAQYRADQLEQRRKHDAAQQGYWSGSLKNEADKIAADGQGGMFEGTGIEAQMLNIIMNPTIPEDHPAKVAAKQRLGRPQTLITPQGTTTTPGYQTDAFFGGTAAAPTPGNFTPKPLSEAEKESGGFYESMLSASENIKKLGDYSPISDFEQARSLTNRTASEEGQMFNQASLQWIRAKLRKESGAVIGADEHRDEYKTYFPVWGDEPAVVQQKIGARREAEKQMLYNAGKLYEERDRGAVEPQTMEEIIAAEDARREALRGN